MGEIGPFSKKELESKLMNISLEEMEKFHEERMRNYRFYIRLAFILGIAAIILYFIWVPAGHIFTGLGLAVITYTQYKKNKWLNLYHNLTYLKKQGMKKRKKMEMDSRKNRSKYTKINDYKSRMGQKKKGQKSN